jgi:hypothetical protein
MTGANKKKMGIIVSLALFALVLIVILPIASYASTSADSVSQDSLVQKSRILRARGIAVDIQKERTTANLTLVLMPDKINRRIAIFNVTGGIVKVNGVEYTIVEGRGFVQYYHHVIAMQANGTGPQGETTTLKLAGRYFWMLGHLHVARIFGTFQVDNTKLQLLLRAAIWVP